MIHLFEIAEVICMAEQMSLVDALLGPKVGVNGKLAGIERLIDWQKLGPLVSKLHDKATGRPAYPALSMLKALYLQSLYDLSDPGLEEALLDRLSFRRFCGLGLDAATPDETTICRFRADCAKAHVLEACFAEITRQLEAKGLMLKKGTLMDATIVQATHRPPSKEAGMGAAHPKEPGAGWISKNGKSYFGYKLHLGVDEGTSLIRKAQFTTAHLQDGAMTLDLVSGDEKAAYADRIYETHARRAALKEMGIKDRLMYRRHKSQKHLPRWKAVMNKLIARRRAPVEALFSALKRIYGRGRARCHSLLVNAADYFAFATVYNLRRASIMTA
jgi:transposase, IS5 family